MEFIVNGQALKVLFRFKVNEKEYLAYLDKNDEISASIIIPDGDNVKLEPITDDKEWDVVEEEIEKRLK